MSVAVIPADVISFKRPFSDLVSRRLTITNHNAEPIAFKVKTSAPLKYLARPNKGRIEAGQSAEVEVVLQAMNIESSMNYTCTDKFLIQSTLITLDRQALSLTDIWSSPVVLPEHEIHGQKLRVAYLPADADGYSPPRKFTYEELESKYKEALLEIERLKSQIQSEGHDERVRAVYIRPWMGSQGH